MGWKTLTIVLGLLVMGGCDGGGDTAAGQVAAPPDPGETIYNRFCFSCHAAGVAGAPRTGVPEAWNARLAKGRAALLQSTIDGMPPGMPAMGLCMQCTEEELVAAIDYMLPAQ